MAITFDNGGELSGHGRIYLTLSCKIYLCTQYPYGNMD